MGTLSASADVEKGGRLYWLLRGMTPQPPLDDDDKPKCQQRRNSAYHSSYGSMRSVRKKVRGAVVLWRQNRGWIGNELARITHTGIKSNVTSG